jgi:hypothetical protein
MKIRLFSLIALGFTLAAALSAQDANPAPPAIQTLPPGPASGNKPGLGWRAGVPGRLAETGMGGRGVAGVVTSVAANHYTVKTEAGESYTVLFSVNTRIMKQRAQRQVRGQAGADPAPPQMLKSSDIKIGDSIAALGEVSTTTRSVGATVILQVDPERARQMSERQANFGKTWLMGKVTAVNEARVTLMGAVDNIPHVFQADENTSFRKHREPAALADVQVGDMVRVEGAEKDGIFVATLVSVMGMPQAGTPTLPRDASPATAPQPDASQPK